MLDRCFGHPCAGAHSACRVGVGSRRPGGGGGGVTFTHAAFRKYSTLVILVMLSVVITFAITILREGYRIFRL